MEAHQEEQREFKFVFIRAKRKLKNEQFGGKIHQDVNGNKKLQQNKGWAEVEI